jgi:hypothetical protein
MRQRRLPNVKRGHAKRKNFQNIDSLTIQNRAKNKKKQKKIKPESDEKTKKNKKLKLQPKLHP